MLLELKRLSANATLTAVCDDSGRQSVISAGDFAATSTVTAVAGSATSVTLKAANANRRALLITNASSATLYVKYGAIAALTSYTVKVAPGGEHRITNPCYTGVVDGIWDAADGFAYVTELS